MFPSSSYYFYYYLAFGIISWWWREGFDGILSIFDDEHCIHSPCYMELNMEMYKPHPCNNTPKTWHF